MKILITGGTGLVGSAFTDGVKVASADYDLRNREDVQRMLETHRPDCVIHTAARVGGIGANITYPATFFYDNIMMNTILIDECRKAGVEKFVCFLSTCVFPDAVQYPLDETKIQLGPPHHSNSAYAYAKRMAEVQIQAYRSQYGVKYFSVIPTNIYGPNDNFSLETGHVIPMLIHKCYLAKKNGTPFEVWGSGNPLREFVYSKDVSYIVQRLVKEYNGTEPVIISTSTEHSIRYIVELITKYMEFDGETRWLSDKPDGQYRKPSSNRRLIETIGDYQFTPLEVGLKETIDWFVANYERIRK
jgi:GDP-L-fucose synthase